MIVNDSNKDISKSFRKDAFELIKAIVVPLLIAYIITRLISPSLVRGSSMYPTFNNNDYLLVNKLAYTKDIADNNDVILFHSHLSDERILIKRVIAKENDVLQIKDSRVIVNGKTLDEVYINEKDFFGEFEAVVPAGKVFVMGDNRNNSLDSRFEDVGFVDKEDIIGKVFLRLYPFNKISSI